MITKDGREVAIENLTADNYIVPKGEERLYHCVVEVVNFDSKTGKRLSKPRIQKFGRKMFDAHIYHSLLKQGYSVTILHDPTKWIAEHKATIAASKKAQAEAAKAAEQKRFDEAVAAAAEKAAAAAVEKALAEERARVAAEAAEKEKAEAEAAEKAAKKAAKKAADANKAAGTTEAPSEGK